MHVAADDGDLAERRAECRPAVPHLVRTHGALRSTDWMQPKGGKLVSMSLPPGTPTQNFVDGEWVGGSRGTFDVHDPSTGEVLCAVPDADPGDVLRAVRAAADAQPGWAATAPRERAEVLRRTFD